MTNQKLLAQVASGFKDTRLGGDCTGFGSICKITGAGNALAKISDVVSTVIGFITILGGIYFMLQFLIAGFEYITAAADKNKLQSAQHRMMHALIGLIVIVSTYAITAMFAEVLGFDSFLLRDIPAVIDSLTPT